MASSGEQETPSGQFGDLGCLLSRNQPESTRPRTWASAPSCCSWAATRSMFNKTPVPPALHGPRKTTNTLVLSFTRGMKNSSAPADSWDWNWCGRVRRWLGGVRSNAANLGGMFATAAQGPGPFIDFMSPLNSWGETSSLLTRGCAQNRCLLAHRRVSRWTRSCGQMQSAMLSDKTHSPCSGQQDNLGLFDSPGHQVFDDLADD